MEPLNCVVRLSDGGCEIWNGEQFHTGDQAAVAADLGLKPEQVTIHQLYAGGSFGRRAQTTAELAVEMAEAAKAIGPNKPVKLVWTRDDDLRHDYLHTVSVERIEAALDAKGMPQAWRHRTAAPTIASRWRW